MLVFDNGFGKCGNWLWVWMLVIFFSSKKLDVVMKFISWVMFKEYVLFVVEKKGWVNVFFGMWVLLYVNFDYMNVVLFV